MKPLKVASIPMGDVDDPEIYAGFAIAEWERSERSGLLKKYKLSPTMWDLGPVNMDHYGYTVNLWCEEYQKEDLVLAQLAGLVQID